MKQKILLSSLLMTAMLFSAVSVSALNHGSAVGKAATLYPIYDTGVPGTPTVGKTIDFKVVSIGGKTWAWANFNGGTIAANAWSSQLRYRQPNYVNTDENLLTGRIAGTQQSYGVFTKAMIMNPLKISFLQEENNIFYESATYDYDNTKSNNADVSDTEKPVLGTCSYDNLTGAKVDLLLSATDNSDAFFYYIEDAANGIAEVSFFNTHTISGLKAETPYNFSITAIDFSGNESTAFTVRVNAGELTSITSGTAQGLYFEFSTTPEGYLRVYGKLADGSLITDAFFRVVPLGGDLSKEEDDIKLVTQNWTGAADFTHIVQTPSLIAPGTTLEFRFGYLQGPIIEGNWEGYGAYKDDIQYVTEGANAGAKIVYIMETVSSTGHAFLQSFSLTQDKNAIYVSSEKAIASMQLYAMNGNLVADLNNTNTANISSFANGVYLLKVKDIVGNEGSFKVVVK